MPEVSLSIKTRKKTTGKRPQKENGCELISIFNFGKSCNTKKRSWLLHVLLWRDNQKRQRTWLKDFNFRPQKTDPKKRTPKNGRLKTAPKKISSIFNSGRKLTLATVTGRKTWIEFCLPHSDSKNFCFGYKLRLKKLHNTYAHVYAQHWTKICIVEPNYTHFYILKSVNTYNKWKETPAKIEQYKKQLFLNFFYGTLSLCWQRNTGTLMHTQLVPQQKKKRFEIGINEMPLNWCYWRFWKKGKLLLFAKVPISTFHSPF